MADQKERGNNDGERWSEGGMTYTVNSTSDSRAGAGGYYLSVTDNETGEHSTIVYTADGDLADVPTNDDYK